MWESAYHSPSEKIWSRILTVLYRSYDAPEIMKSARVFNGVDAKHGGNETDRFRHLLRQHHETKEPPERIFYDRSNGANGRDI